ncbi:Tetratricopeptide repeat-containing protein [Hydrocarboniphaga daqingensis]|uniref:Tetratricopeptide repeat-containing protein n=1 Tax=Hydrocarboniphaga daqingensis TaxID=490188 RepID=A0A1M5NWG5_9GAMM|nr:hypothetical protein [Hydrocarboniphaga daqingensis]SHG93323.1 Tetratricopeptide repeat-containing protein [Hydrocarboniphaga daqingensis]
MRGKIEGIYAGVLRGWAWDEQAPDETLQLQIVVDGTLAGRVKADHPRGDLRTAGIGTGDHGYEFVVPLPWRDGREHVVSVCLDADTSTLVCDPAVINFGAQSCAINGRVESGEPGRIQGWAWDRLAPANRVVLDLAHNGAIFTSVVADRFRRDLEKAGIGDGAHAFRYVIPLATFDSLGCDELLVEVRTAAELGAQWIGSITVSRPADDADLQRPGLAPRPQIEPAVVPVAVVEPEEPRSVAEFIEAAGKAEVARDYAAAITLLRRGLDLTPGHFEYLFRLARVHLAKGDNLTAKDYAAQALALRPGHHKPSITMARVSELEGQRALALEYWKRVPASDSAYAERMIKSSRMFLALERIDEGRQALEQAVQLRPIDTGPARALAQLLEELSEYDAAIAAWERLSLLDPDDKKLRSRIESLRLRRREPERLRIPARFRRAMHHLQKPVLLAIGNELADCLAASRLVVALAAYFQCSIALAVPAMSGAVRRVFAGHPAVSSIETADALGEVPELAFVLPEYLMTCGGVSAPVAGSVYNFVEMRSLRSADLMRRYQAYAQWIGDLTGMPLALLPATPAIAPALAPSATIDHSVVLAFGRAERGAPLSQAQRDRLHAAAHDAGYTVRRWEPSAVDGDESTTRQADSLSTAFAGAHVVITDAEDIALLGLALGIGLVSVAHSRDTMIGALAPSSVVITDAAASPVDAILDRLYEHVPPMLQMAAEAEVIYATGLDPVDPGDAVAMEAVMPHIESHSRLVTTRKKRVK